MQIGHFTASGVVLDHAKVPLIDHAGPGWQPARGRG
jgi:hypothetical protein